MSTLNVLNISDGTDTVATGYVVNGSAKAWVCAGGDASIRSSMNVSGQTDYGTGDYTYGLTAAMVDNQYSQQASIATGTRDRIAQRDTARDAAGVMSVATSNARTNTAVDHAHAGLIVGDLA